MDAMHADYRATQDSNNHSPQFLKEFIDCDYSDTELVGVVDSFVSYRRLSRIWTVQELILARELRFLCGTVIVPLDTIWKGSLLLSYTGPCSALNRVQSTSELQWAMQFGIDVVTEYIR